MNDIKSNWVEKDSIVLKLICMNCSLPFGEHRNGDKGCPPFEAGVMPATYFRKEGYKQRLNFHPFKPEEVIKKLQLDLEKIKSERDEWIEKVNLNMETLRDRFAMAALTGLIGWTPPGCDPNPSTQEEAEGAYLYANAMLEARKSNESKK